MTPIRGVTGGAVERIHRLVGPNVVKLVRGSGFIFTCRLGGAVLALGTQLALARWMGAEELGRYLLAFSWCILLSRLSGLGYDSASPRFIGEGLALDDPDAVRGYVTFTRRTVWRIGWLVGAVGVAATAVSSTRMGESQWPLVVAFATVPFMAGIGIHQGIALAFSRFKPAILPKNVIRPLAFLVVVVVFWWVGAPLNATTTMLIQAGAVVLTFVGLLSFMRAAVLRPVLEDAPSTFRRRAWTRTAVSLLVISLFRDYLPELSVIVASLHLSPDQIAVFTVSYRTALPITFVIFAVDGFIMPGAAQIWASGDKASLQRMVEHASMLRFAASSAAAVGFVVLGEWLLSLFGEEFVAGYTLLMILVVAQLVVASVGPVLPLLNVSGHEDKALRVYGLALLVVAALVAIFAPIWGITGVGAAVACVMIVASTTLNVLVIRHLGIRPSVLSSVRARLSRGGRSVGS